MGISKIAYYWSWNETGHLGSQDMYVCVPSPPTWFGTVSLLFTAVFAGLSSWFHLPFPHRGVLGVQTRAPLCPAFSTHSADLNSSCSLMHHVLYPSRHLSSLWTTGYLNLSSWGDCGDMEHFTIIQPLKVHLFNGKTSKRGTRRNPEAWQDVGRGPYPCLKLGGSVLHKHCSLFVLSSWSASSYMLIWGRTQFSSGRSAVWTAYWSASHIANCNQRGWTSEEYSSSPAHMHGTSLQ